MNIEGNRAEWSYPVKLSELQEAVEKILSQKILAVNKQKSKIRDMFDSGEFENKPFKEPQESRHARDEMMEWQMWKEFFFRLRKRYEALGDDDPLVPVNKMDMQYFFFNELGWNY